MTSNIDRQIIVTHEVAPGRPVTRFIPWAEFKGTSFDADGRGTITYTANGRKEQDSLPKELTPDRYKKIFNDLTILGGSANFIDLSTPHILEVVEKEQKRELKKAAGARKAAVIAGGTYEEPT